MENITIEDFIKVDIRIGEVVDASNVENSSKLIALQVDFGAEIGKRQILTGMQKWFAPEDFKGNKYMFIVNMKPRKMAGTESQGMIIATDVDEKPFLIPIDTSVKNGSKIR